MIIAGPESLAAGGEVQGLMGILCSLSKRLDAIAWLQLLLKVECSKSRTDQISTAIATKRNQTTLHIPELGTLFELPKFLFVREECSRLSSLVKLACFSVIRRISSAMRANANCNCKGAIGSSIVLSSAAVIAFFAVRVIF
jgi:hypothetical protein